MLYYKATAIYYVCERYYILYCIYCMSVPLQAHRADKYDIYNMRYYI